MKFKNEQIKPLLEELKHADIFRIAYNAKKYNKMIIRHGVYDDNTRAWITKTDELAFTYYDLDQKGYRTATNICWFHGVTIIDKKEMH